MIQLFKWYIEKIRDNMYTAHGYVAGHPKLADGTHIHTSSLVQVGEDGEKSILLVTHLGNKYHLAGEDICCEEIRMTAKTLSHLGYMTSVRTLCDCQPEKRGRNAESLVSVCQSMNCTWRCWGKAA